MRQKCRVESHEKGPYPSYNIQCALFFLPDTGGLRGNDPVEDTARSLYLISIALLNSLRGNDPVEDTARRKLAIGSRNNSTSQRQRSGRGYCKFAASLYSILSNACLRGNDPVEDTASRTVVLDIAFNAGSQRQRSGRGYCKEKLRS